MFRMMKNPLKFPVRNGNDIVIPKGAEGVEIDFGASNLIAHNDIGEIVQLKHTNSVVPSGFTKCNVYRWNGKIYHA